MNPYEISARREKATQLEYAIVSTWNAIDPVFRTGRSLAVAVETWGDEEWKAASIKAGTHEPSDECRELVLRALRLREEVYDPFDIPGAA